MPGWGRGPHTHILLSTLRALGWDKQRGQEIPCRRQELAAGATGAPNAPAID